jgi:hypothetical protein
MVFLVVLAFAVVSSVRDGGVAKVSLPRGAGGKVQLKSEGDCGFLVTGPATLTEELQVGDRWLLTVGSKQLSANLSNAQASKAVSGKRNVKFSRRSMYRVPFAELRNPDSTPGLKCWLQKAIAFTKKQRAAPERAARAWVSLADTANAAGRVSFLAQNLSLGMYQFALDASPASPLRSDWLPRYARALVDQGQHPRAVSVLTEALDTGGEVDPRLQCELALTMLPLDQRPGGTADWPRAKHILRALEQFGVNADHDAAPADGGGTQQAAVRRCFLQVAERLYWLALELDGMSSAEVEQAGVLRQGGLDLAERACSTRLDTDCSKLQVALALKPHDKAAADGSALLSHPILAHEYRAAYGNLKALANSTASLSNATGYNLSEALHAIQGRVQQNKATLLPGQAHLRDHFLSSEEVARLHEINAAHDLTAHTLKGDVVNKGDPLSVVHNGFAELSPKLSLSDRQFVHSVKARVVNYVNEKLQIGVSRGAGDVKPMLVVPHAMAMFRYTKGGQHVAHMDTDHKGRCVSSSILLNDGYEGGAFHTHAKLPPDFPRIGSVANPLGGGGAGRLTVFLSETVHSVSPVLVGERSCFFLWLNCDPAKDGEFIPPLSVDAPALEL